MATRTINFEFVPMGARGVDKWNTAHAVPTSLFAPLDVQRTSAHKAHTIPAINGIASSYQAICDKKISASTCIVCDSKPVLALLRPTAFLHLDDDPRVHVYTIPICKKKTCREEAIHVNDDIMDKTVAEGVEKLSMGRFCVCGKSEGTMRCSRCKVSSYCCQEHQRQDWKAHKKICYVLQSMREVNEGVRLWGSDAEEASSSSTSGETDSTAPKQKSAQTPKSTTKALPTRTKPAEQKEATPKIEQAK